jgi:hypothetical protein
MRFLLTVFATVSSKESTEALIERLSAQPDVRVKMRVCPRALGVSNIAHRTSNVECRTIVFFFSSFIFWSHIDAGGAAVGERSEAGGTNHQHDGTAHDGHRSETLQKETSVWESVD